MQPAGHANRAHGGLGGFLAVACLLAATTSLTAGEGLGDDTLYESRGLRIYRTLDRNGRPAVVLTNLDSEGNLLDGTSETVLCPSPEPPVTAASAASPQGPGAAPADDGRAGTTLIININTGRGNPVDEVPVGSALFPVLAFNGIPGPFRYPAHLAFLGYSLDGSSPSFFGGLGLNAGNRFGLKTGRSCGSGYDCLFRP